MPICPNTACHFENPEGCRFCLECGMPLPNLLRCKNCSAELPVAAKFCPNCGTKVEAERPQVPSSASPQGSGIGIGERNVIAGDVIARKEEVKVAGDATFIKHEDDTKRILTCSVCGRNVPFADGYTCPGCGRFVCSDHYDADLHRCAVCAALEDSDREREYGILLEKAYADGKVDLQERAELDSARQRLGIGPERARVLEAGFTGQGKLAHAFTRIERHKFETATRLLMEEYRPKDAEKELGELWQAHPEMEDVLALFLRIQKDLDPVRVLSVIDGLGADFTEAYTIRCETLMNLGRLDDAERILERAKSLWPGSRDIACTELEFLLRLWRTTGEDRFLDEARHVARQLKGSESSAVVAYTLALLSRAEGDAEAMTKAEAACATNGLPLYPFLRSRARGLHVSADGSREYRRISDALRDANGGNTISVHGGIYNESLFIDKPVRLIGVADGPGSCKPIVWSEERYVLDVADGARIESLCLKTSLEPIPSDFRYPDRPQDIDIHEYWPACILLRGDAVLSDLEIANFRCNGIQIQGDSKPVMKGLDIHDGRRNGLVLYDSCSPTADYLCIHDCANFGILVRDSASGVFTSCDIHRNGGAGVQAAMGGAPILRRCSIHDGLEYGVVVYERGAGLIEESDIFGNAAAGILIYEAGAPTVRGCSIHDGMENGIFVFKNGAGTIEGCDIFQNAKTGIRITEGGNPAVRNCKIHDGKTGGVYILANGTGTIEDCDIFQNAKAGIEITEGGNPAIRNSKIHDGKTSGIFIHANGTGTIEDCDIFQNAKAGIEIKEGGNPVIRNCRINDGKAGGVFINANGKGTIDTCDIFANMLSGLEVGDGGEPNVIGCKFHDGKGYGITLRSKASGKLAGCTTSNNFGCGLFVENGVSTYLSFCDFKDKCPGAEKMIEHMKLEEEFCKIGESFWNGSIDATH